MNEAACPSLCRVASFKIEGSIVSYIKALGHHLVWAWYHIRLKVPSLKFLEVVDMAPGWKVSVS